MRISTSQVFDAGAMNMLNSQSALYKQQNQLATGRRILAPEDDPMAAAQALFDIFRDEAGKGRFPTF